MPLADSHIHLFQNGATRRYSQSVAEDRDHDLTNYESLRATHDIARALVVGFEGDDARKGNNDHILGLGRDRPWIAPAAYVPTWPPASTHEVDLLASRGFIGLVVYIRTPQAAEHVASWPREVCQHISASFRVVSLNASAELTSNIARFVADLSPCPVLFSHLGLPGRYALPPTPAEACSRIGPLLDLASMEHVGVKLSGFYAVSEPREADSAPKARPFVDALFEHFGARRLFWGSDFLPSLEWAPFQTTVEPPLPRGLSAAETARVMGGNLVRLLGEASEDVAGRRP